jgi:hypothetical protein
MLKKARKQEEKRDIYIKEELENLVTAFTIFIENI